ncbi:MAG: dihydrodipicolinate synthase family protein [Pyrinomonadaceae bacterium]|nr:dihydrodipicolinate synthase family protein [Phycisphaerales bacterium]
MGGNLMKQSQWQGVIPAITTKFNEDFSVDLAFVARHAAWMIDHGCTGIVTPGSLGEGGALTREEKRDMWRACVGAVGKRTPVIAAVSSLTTAEAVMIACDAAACGCEGLMVLPPYVYKGDWRETKAYFSAVIRATPLSCMLYNNPIAYGTDTTPEQLAELAAELPNLHAIKESSADVRRLAAIRSIVGDRIALLVGVDDLIVEGVAAGASGWIAGLVNAFPAESVRLFNLAREGKAAEAFELYRWFLPLLRMDVVPQFVHLIKLVQQEVGMGTETVRPPRLSLQGAIREEALRTIRKCVATRPG